MSISELKKLSKRFGALSIFGIILKEAEALKEAGNEVKITKVGSFFLLIKSS